MPVNASSNSRAWRAHAFVQHAVSNDPFNEHTRSPSRRTRAHEPTTRVVRPRTNAIQPENARRVYFLTCDMAFGPYGEYWRQTRRICVLHLLSTRRILSFRRIREQEAAALVDRIRAGARAHPTAVVNLSEVLIRYSNAVISRAALGDGDYRLEGDVGGEMLRQVLADTMELLATTPMREIAPWLGWVDTVTGLEAKTRRTFEVLDGLLERVIADHRSRGPDGQRRRVGDSGDDHRDFVDVLLGMNEMDNEAGFQLNTDNIKAIILDMFIAGTETSYTVLEWAMAELINHPHQMRKLQQSIRTVVGFAGGHVTGDDLHNLPYLKSVITETLRLHPSAPLLPRETIEDTELLGYRVPAQTRVMINAWAIGRDPATWEQADEFVPERFMDAPMDYSKVVGQEFRLAPSIELALASMLYHFDWEMTRSGRRPGASVLDMSEEFGLSLRLKGSLLLVAKPWLGP